MTLHPRSDKRALAVSSSGALTRVELPEEAQQQHARLPARYRQAPLRPVLSSTAPCNGALWSVLRVSLIALATDSTHLRAASSRPVRSAHRQPARAEFRARVAHTSAISQRCHSPGERGQAARRNVLQCGRDRRGAGRVQQPICELNPGASAGGRFLWKMAISRTSLRIVPVILYSLYPTIRRFNQYFFHNFTAQCRGHRGRRRREHFDRCIPNADSRAHRATQRRQMKFMC
ncbi:hypothetical protein B0H15DRAFT_459143 [Mycena belliarum]|uniref:Uncharacterized protein n=1 Tax=Mycena belliarum TaxID=1033014 RepID=A0AAD6XSS0_9AGAR|nr:hypothetical protein B0H15DRAFT_459143 [Mycena belliae]